MEDKEAEDSEVEDDEVNGNESEGKNLVKYNWCWKGPKIEGESSVRLTE